MIHRVLLGVAVLVAVSSSTARAGIRRPGEVAADVTVRQWPENDAPPAGDLAAGTQVVAHERRHGWVRITGAARGWIPVEAFARARSEDDQRQRLLGELAAASADLPPQERTDADLMYDAVRQWHGEPPGSATIDKVLAQSKRASDSNRHVTREKIRSLFWKDPFSDEPQKLVLVRREDRELLAAHAAKRGHTRGVGDDSETSRLRAELASMRAELSTARAEANRARAALARLEGDRGSQGSSGAEAIATRGDSDEGLAKVARHARRQASSGHSRHLAERSETSSSNGSETREGSRHASRAVLTDGTPFAASDRRRVVAGSVVAEAAPAPAEKAPSTPPSGWRSSDPRGIIVVPMDTPVIVRADKKPRASR